MSLIARWDYLTVYLCESCGGVVGLRPEPCANCARPLTKVEVVPADQLRGAVDVLRELDGQLAAVIALGDDGDTLDRLADLREHIADTLGGQ